MKNQYLIIIFILLGFVGCVPNDSDGPRPSDVFVKFYGLGSNEAIDIVRTSTGEIIVLAQNTVNGVSDFYLLKTDEGGNEIASRIIDLADGSDDHPKRLKPIGEDEFMIVGYIQSEDEETGIDHFTGVWAKINSDLEIISNGSPGGNGFNFMDSLIAVDIVKTSDAAETFVLLGHSSVASRRYAGDQTPAGEFQIYMGKVDDQDSVYWQKSHGYSGNESALSIFELENRGFLVVGSTRAVLDEYTGTNLYIFETNEFGTADEGALVTGIPGADPTGDDIPYTVKKSSLGYSIVGSTEDAATGASRGFHLAVSPSGQLIDNSVSVLYNDFGFECVATTFSRTLNNELMVLGYMENFLINQGEGGGSTTKNEEILVMRVSPILGRLEGFDQNYGTTVGSDQAVGAITLPDGDVLVAATIDFGSGTTMVGLLRLNANGELRD